MIEGNGGEDHEGAEEFLDFVSVLKKPRNSIEGSATAVGNDKEWDSGADGIGQGDEECGGIELVGDGKGDN